MAGKGRFGRRPESKRNDFHHRILITYDDVVFHPNDHTALETGLKYSDFSKQEDLRRSLSRVTAEPIASKENTETYGSIRSSKLREECVSERKIISKQPKTRKSNKAGGKHGQSKECWKSVDDIEGNSTTRNTRSKYRDNGRGKTISRIKTSHPESRGKRVCTTTYAGPIKMSNRKGTTKPISTFKRELQDEEIDVQSNKKLRSSNEDCKNRPSSPYSSISDDTSCFSSIQNAEDHLFTLTSFNNIQPSAKSEFIAKTLAELVSMKVTNETEDIFTVPLFDFMCCLQDIGICFESESSFSEIFMSLPVYFFINEKEKSIEPRTSMKICEKYTNDINVPNCDCFGLHMCKFYLVGKCMSEPCKFSHNEREMHNQNVLKYHCLHKLPPQHLGKLLKDVKNRNSTTSPTVCKFYNNEGGCSKRDRCQHLHVCKHFVTGSCKFGPGCKREHNFKSHHSEEILYKFGLEEYQLNYEVLLPLIKMNMIDGVIKTKRESMDNISSMRQHEKPVNTRLRVVKEPYPGPFVETGRYFSLDRDTSDRYQIQHSRTDDNKDEILPRRNDNMLKHGSDSMTVQGSTSGEDTRTVQIQSRARNISNETKSDNLLTNVVAYGAMDDSKIRYQTMTTSSIHQDSNPGNVDSEIELENDRSKMNKAQKRSIGDVVDDLLSMTKESSQLKDRKSQKLTTYDETCIANTLKKPEKDVKENNLHMLVISSDYYTESNDNMQSYAVRDIHKEVNIQGENDETVTSYDENEKKVLLLEPNTQKRDQYSEITLIELNDKDGKGGTDSSVGPMDSLLANGMEQFSNTATSSEEMTTFTNKLVQTPEEKLSTPIHIINQPDLKEDSQGDSSTKAANFKSALDSEEILKKTTNLVQTIEIEESDGCHVLTIRNNGVEVKITGTSASDLQNKIKSTATALWVQSKSMRSTPGHEV